VPKMRREKGGETLIRLLHGERGIIPCKRGRMRNRQVYLRLIKAMVHRHKETLH
jgi:hypothetical protein